MTCTGCESEGLYQVILNGLLSDVDLYDFMSGGYMLDDANPEL